METKMEYLDIAGLTPRASRIALGTWAIGGSMWGGSDQKDAIRTIHTAIDRGVTLIDTAPVYGFGESEEIVGQALAAGGRRKDVLVATKVGLNWAKSGPFRDSRPERIKCEVDESLKRLKTDYIDLYQVHWPDPLVPIEETAGAMADLLQAGKIRAIGVSNYSPAQMDAFRKVTPIHAVQPPYNLFERGIEHDILPYADRNDIALLAYGPLCRGLLTGKINAKTEFSGDDLRKVDPKFLPPRFGQYLAAVSALDRLSRLHYGRTVMALAVRWVLEHANSIALWGARRPEQLENIDSALGWSIDAVGMSRIDRIIAEHVREAIGPEFMAPPTRHSLKHVA
jgi:aryl-alcohol dehydrogenase-like predicted oxidoreductase